MTTLFAGFVPAASAVDLPAAGFAPVGDAPVGDAPVGDPVVGFIASFVAGPLEGVFAEALECPDVTAATVVETGVFAGSAGFVASTTVPLVGACAVPLGVPDLARAAIACGCWPAVVDAPDFTWRKVHAGFAFVNSAMAEGGVADAPCAGVFVVGMAVFVAVGDNFALAAICVGAGAWAVVVG